jgi:hypothetical protein
MLPVSLFPLQGHRAWRAERHKSVAGILAALVALGGCATATQREGHGKIAAESTSDGVALTEDGRPVLFYRRVPEPGREAWRAHYLHPVYSVAGAVITEDAPPDHPHHRGVFWAWRRILVDDVQVADSWVGTGIVQTVDRSSTSQLPDGSAEIDVRVLWTVQIDGAATALIEENSTIRAFPVTDGRRRLELLIRLRALRAGVAIAGTNYDKGYGGLSLRFANTEKMSIMAGGRPVHATVAGMEAGPEVEFLWPSLPTPWPPRVMASCSVNGRPWTYWVLRQEPSMQNCAFPGSSAVAVPLQNSLELAATLHIH